ncbi:hypothetical protein [Floccifex sp.]|uniref:hypothetical protein n=1 Tax=Floccifex sp. TaxID=2815810 RepID=UPI003F0581F2
MLEIKEPRGVFSSDFCKGISSVVNLFGVSNKNNYDNEIRKIRIKYSSNYAYEELSENWFTVGNVLREAMDEYKKEITGTKKIKKRRK